MAKVLARSCFQGCRRVIQLVQRQRALSASASRLDDASSRGGTYTTDFSDAQLTFDPKAITPTYRVMNSNGSVFEPSNDPQLDEGMLLKMYRKMVTLTLMDWELYKANKMGLISFYMVCDGEEGTHIGSAAALDPEDMVFGQYREAGVLLWRGYTLDQVTDQCFSTRHDLAKGRQMPVHYGSRDLNFQFISSPLATQMPQAPGYAYGLKMSGSKNCVITYFGDGAAQEGDSHAAMNFASTLGCPVLFFCRNNGYAISTPVEDNYHGDGIVTRGRGYGMEAIRVDGNDVLAVYNVTKYARNVAVSEQRPVLIEAMTYRLGSHSSSDDQRLYQPMDEVKRWKEKYHPVLRFQKYLEGRGLWDPSQQEELERSVTEELKQSMRRAGTELKPSVDEMFQDVYDTIPPPLERQRQQMWDHLKRYKDRYPTLKDYDKTA